MTYVRNKTMIISPYVYGMGAVGFPCKQPKGNDEEHAILEALIYYNETDPKTRACRPVPFARYEQGWRDGYRALLCHMSTLLCSIVNGHVKMRPKEFSFLNNSKKPETFLRNCRVRLTALPAILHRPLPYHTIQNICQVISVFSCVQLSYTKLQSCGQEFGIYYVSPIRVQS